VGIPGPHTEKIFEEYTSYAGAQDRSGAGLGLAICKMVINRHQGHIWAENTSDGALFSFVLPLRRSEPVSLTPKSREVYGTVSFGQ
jgi:K+-sensing histidine kinase KdpD